MRIKAFSLTEVSVNAASTNWNINIVGQYLLGKSALYCGPRELLTADALQPHHPSCSEGEGTQTLLKWAVLESFCLVRTEVELEENH